MKSYSSYRVGTIGPFYNLYDWHILCNVNSIFIYYKNDGNKHIEQANLRKLLFWISVGMLAPFPQLNLDRKKVQYWHHHHKHYHHKHYITDITIINITIINITIVLHFESKWNYYCIRPFTQSEFLNILCKLTVNHVS